MGQYTNINLINYGSRYGIELLNSKVNTQEFYELDIASSNCFVKKENKFPHTCLALRANIYKDKVNIIDYTLTENTIATFISILKTKVEALGISYIINDLVDKLFKVFRLGGV